MGAPPGGYGGTTGDGVERLGNMFSYNPPAGFASRSNEEFDGTSDDGGANMDCREGT